MKTMNALKGIGYGLCLDFLILKRDCAEKDEKNQVDRIFKGVGKEIVKRTAKKK